MVHRGHHKRVATNEDPASSAMNENFWVFIWQCLWRSLVSALRIEAKFQKNSGRSFWTLQNRILTPYLFSFAIDYAIYKYLGPQALAAHLVQSFITAFLTDNTNYIEHYGLRRQRKSNKVCVASGALHNPHTPGLQAHTSQVYRNCA